MGAKEKFDKSLVFLAAVAVPLGASALQFISKPDTIARLVVAGGLISLPLVERRLRKHFRRAKQKEEEKAQEKICTTCKKNYFRQRCQCGYITFE